MLKYAKYLVLLDTSGKRKWKLEHVLPQVLQDIYMLVAQEQLYTIKSLYKNKFTINSIINNIITVYQQTYSVFLKVNFYSNLNYQQQCE